MTLIQFHIITWSALWLFQIGCVITGRLDWYALFFMPIAVATAWAIAEFVHRTERR